MTNTYGPSAWSASDAPKFSATLVSHRSLSANGFLLLMILFGVVCLVSGIVFLIVGAWPVFFFFGLDILLLYIAFRLNYRSGRLHEVVDLSRELLTLQGVYPSGRREEFSFNPTWVKVVLSEYRNGRTELQLASRGRAVPFGRFLTDDERRSFSSALQSALVEARGGPRI